MNEKRTTIEKIAPSIDEAIDSGLIELGLQRADVEIEILDEGSRGLFGLGSRHARVRLTVSTATTAAPVSQRRPAPETAKVKDAPTSRTEKPAEKVDEKPAPLPARKAAIEPRSLEEELTLNAAKETIEEMLELMQVSATIDIYYGEADERQSRPPLMIDLTGPDLSILIGKKAETLSALQYITSLIVSKKVGHSVTLVVDVENFRQRRASQVRQIATRVADQVVKTGRRQALEPMPANERRIVHMELRSNEQVRTESTGVEPHRKVVVYPVD